MIGLGLCLSGFAAENFHGRPSLVLSNRAARVVVDLGGGSIGEFRLAESQVNPLSWAAPAGETSPRAFGHFLCLDRWGPPSESEGAQGMPYHGEAAHVLWESVPSASKTLEATMSAALPKAGLAIRRTVRMAPASAVFTVREEISNTRPLGRIFNAVQHPTIAPPFLDASTRVDCNGTDGFAQGGKLPNPEALSERWPLALKPDGASSDLRRLGSDPNPNVVSYIIEDTRGWVTAAHPGQGLLIGYVWLASDYPWVSLWREVKNGQPAARGLEFGTTGLHQPFPILVKKGRIWDRPLFEYIDSRETITKSYTAFLLKIPSDFTGVASVTVQEDQIIVREQGTSNPREFHLKQN